MKRALILLSLVPGMANADAELSRAIDAVFSGIGENQPGCAAAVIHKGEFIHKAGYGLANKPGRIGVAPGTVARRVHQRKVGRNGHVGLPLDARDRGAEGDDLLVSRKRITRDHRTRRKGRGARDQ